MQMRRARRSHEGANVSCGSGRIQACKRPPSDSPELATLAAPDVKSAVAWRTFELNPDGTGMGMTGMHGMGGRAAAIPHDGHQRPLVRYGSDRCDGEARDIGNLGDRCEHADAHPFHVHGASFRILSKGGRKPSATKSGWKDVVLVEQHAELLVRFDNLAPPKMPFMYHCHILEHEDHGMMGQFAVV